MAIEFRADRFYLGLWFFELPAGRFNDHPLGGNFLGGVSRPSDALSEWTLNYRFRWYKDNKVFESEDHRSFWAVSFSAVDDKDVFDVANKTISMVAMSVGETADFLELNCPGDEVIQKITAAKKDWMHFQIQPAD